MDPRYAPIASFERYRSLCDPRMVPAFSYASDSGPISTEPIFDCVAALLIGSQVGIAHAHTVHAPNVLDELLDSFGPVHRAYMLGGDPRLYRSMALSLRSSDVQDISGICDWRAAGFGSRKELLFDGRKLVLATRRGVRVYPLRLDDEASAKTSWSSSAGVSMR